MLDFPNFEPSCGGVIGVNVVDVPTYLPPDNDLHVPRQLHVQVEARGLSYEHQLLHMSVLHG